jgi:hypothetical protein
MRKSFTSCNVQKFFLGVGNSELNQKERGGEETLRKRTPYTSLSMLSLQYTPSTKLRLVCAVPK